uniref:Transmembrane protein 236 n=1 Tax=Loxodonta africana TaxID=9785 RepID=G3TVW2_LOXAF
MASGRLIKLVVFELLEFAAFSIPTLVIVEQFASVYQRTRNIAEKTYYWLIVSCSIAYVASVTLLIWVPIKVLLFKKHHLRKKIKGWRPVMMMCVVLTTLPCFSFSIAVTEVQKNINGSTDVSALPDLPVSLVLTCLIVVDIIEKLRIYPLKGSQKSSEDSHIHTTTLQQITTVTEKARQKEENRAPSQAASRAEMSRRREAAAWSLAPVLAGPVEPSFHSGILRIMSRQDIRADIVLWGFLLWFDTIEMVFSLIIVLGTITPVLGLCKNVLV